MEKQLGRYPEKTEINAGAWHHLALTALHGHKKQTSDPLISGDSPGSPLALVLNTGVRLQKGNSTFPA